MAGLPKPGKPIKLKPIQPRVGKSFKIKYLPKNKHLPLNIDKKPPWDADTRIPGVETIRYDKRTRLKIRHVEVPAPDYTCFRGSRYSLKGDRAVPNGEVLLLHKNYEPAPWCNPKIYTKPVKHCIEFLNGRIRKEYDVEMPNNYRNIYLNEEAIEKVQLQSVDEARKAYIYVPVPPDHKKDPADEKNQEKRVFYESTQALLFKENENSPHVPEYRKLDQYALITDEETLTKTKKENRREKLL